MFTDKLKLIFTPIHKISSVKTSRFVIVREEALE